MTTITIATTQRATTLTIMAKARRATMMTTTMATARQATLQRDTTMTMMATGEDERQWGRRDGH